MARSAPPDLGAIKSASSNDFRRDQLQAKLNDVNRSSAKHYVQSTNSLAWVLATCPDDDVRNGTEAVELMENALALYGESSFLLDTLAAAYAEAGRLEDARITQKSAITMLIKEGDAESQSDYESRLSAYERNLPWRSAD